MYFVSPGARCCAPTHPTPPPFLGGGKYQKKKIALALALGHVCVGMGDVGAGEVAACWERSVNVSCIGLVEVKKASFPPPLRPLMGLLTGRLFCHASCSLTQPTKTPKTPGLLRQKRPVEFALLTAFFSRIEPYEDDQIVIFQNNFAQIHFQVSKIFFCFHLHLQLP
jgi:hypothetical protein